MQISKLFLTGTAAILAVAGVFASKARIQHLKFIATCDGGACVNRIQVPATVDPVNHTPILTAQQSAQKVTCLIPSSGCLSNQPVYSIPDVD